MWDVKERNQGCFQGVCSKQLEEQTCYLMRWKTVEGTALLGASIFCLGHAKFEKPIKVWRSWKKSR